MVIMYGESESLKHILWELRKAKLPLYSLEDIKDFQENWENNLQNHEHQQQERLSTEIREGEKRVQKEG